MHDVTMQRLKNILKAGTLFYFCSFLFFSLPLGEAAFKSGSKNPAPAESEAGDFSEVMNSLLQSMELWPTLTIEQKVLVTAAVIEVFEKHEGVKISLPPPFYAQQVDQMLASNPEFPQGLEDMIRILAVMEYDFDTGEDKDQLAKQVLGEDLYQLNKQRMQQQGQTVDY